MKAGPLIHSGDTTKRLMIITILAMLPMVVGSIWANGLDKMILYAAAIISVIAMESVFKARLSFEFSGLVTAIILVLILPANSPWWIAVIGAIIAIGLGKFMYGGFGQNVFNPAVLSRVLLMGLFPALFIMPLWTVDGVTAATSLSKEIGASMPSLSSLFFSSSPGSLAEAMPITVLIGGALLLVFQLVDWRVPLFYLATIAFMAIVLPGSEKIIGHSPHLGGNPLLHMLAGGSLISAFFILTDPVTSPYSSNGRVVFAVIAGVFTMLIRYYTPYPDGAAFGVLLANAMVPTIDRYLRTSSASLLD